MSIERFDGRMGEAFHKRLYQDAKLGATAGWTVRAAADTWASTCAASQTNSTLVVPLHGLYVGDRLVGFDLVGQIEASGGNDVTLVAAMYRFTAAAADNAAAAVANWSKTIAHVDASDLLLDKNVAALLVEPVDYITVAEGETYFLLLTATTAGSTDISLLGVHLYIQPVR